MKFSFSIQIKTSYRVNEPHILNLAERAKSLKEIFEMQIAINSRFRLRLAENGSIFLVDIETGHRTNIEDVEEEIVIDICRKLSSSICFTRINYLIVKDLCNMLQNRDSSFSFIVTDTDGLVLTSPRLS